MVPLKWSPSTNLFGPRLLIKSPNPPNVQYNLTLVASDTLHENFTMVRIHVKDVNDLPPKFGQSLYEATIIEEDDKGLPKRILQVCSATKAVSPLGESSTFLTICLFSLSLFASLFHRLRTSLRSINLPDKLL